MMMDRMMGVGVLKIMVGGTKEAWDSSIMVDGPDTMAVGTMVVDGLEKRME